MEKRENEKEGNEQQKDNAGSGKVQLAASLKTSRDIGSGSSSDVGGSASQMKLKASKQVTVRQSAMGQKDTG